MQRLVEQPADSGNVFNGQKHLGRAHYHLSVYQHFSESEGESVPANLEVEGRLTPIDPIDLSDLHRRSVELTLRLADGRSLDFIFSDDEGRLHSTARSLYRA